MNRAEVQHLQEVAAICQATDASPLGKVIIGIRDIISKEKAIIDSDALELPGELRDIITDSSNQMSNFVSSYEAKGGDIAKSNQTIMEMINRSMQRAQATGADSIQNMSGASKAAEDIKGGVKI